MFYERESVTIVKWGKLVNYLWPKTLRQIFHPLMTPTNRQTERRRRKIARNSWRNSLKHLRRFSQDMKFSIVSDLLLIWFRRKHSRKTFNELHFRLQTLSDVDCWCTFHVLVSSCWQQLRKLHEFHFQFCIFSWRNFSPAMKF